MVGMGMVDDAYTSHTSLITLYSIFLGEWMNVSSVHQCVTLTLSATQPTTDACIYNTLDLVNPPHFSQLNILQKFSFSFSASAHTPWPLFHGNESGKWDFHCHFAMALKTGKSRKSTNNLDKQEGTSSVIKSLIKHTKNYAIESKR